MAERTVEFMARESEHNVRSMIAEAHGGTFASYSTLETARLDPDASLVMQGDWGGSIYLTCPVGDVGCSGATLDQVLAILDGLDWNDPEGCEWSLERLPVGSSVAGGTGGGVIEAQLWLNKSFNGRTDTAHRDLRDVVASVVRGDEPATALRLPFERR